MRRLAEFRKLRSYYNTVKRVKKREKQMKINEEIKRPYGVNNPREFWSIVKCSILGPEIREDVLPVETWPDHFKIRESEYVRGNESNGSEGRELGLGTVTYPLRHKITI